VDRKQSAHAGEEMLGECVFLYLLAR